MRQELSEELIDKYLKGTCTEEEQQFVEDYLAGFQDNKEDWITGFHGDEKSIKDTIYAKIEVNSGFRTGKIIQLGYVKNLLRIAATIAIIAASSILIWQSVNRDMVSQTVLMTGNSQVNEVILTDGTIVKVNANSTLIYPNRFRGNKRLVELDGEAYFEVSHNPNNPFVVETSEANVKVLGTKFNLEAYSKDPVLRASLLEGSIELTSGRNTNLLEPGQEMHFHKDTRNIQISTFNPKSVTAWFDHELSFDQTPLPVALRRIGNYYGISIVVENDLVMERKITGNFRNNSIEELTNKLDTLFHADIKYNESILIIR